MLAFIYHSFHRNFSGDKNEPTNKLLGGSKNKKKGGDVSDLGVTKLKEEEVNKDKMDDSFEKYYNKDLDLDEGKVISK